MQSALPLSSTLTSEEKAKLWASADKLRGHLDAAEYKHVVLGLIFLKYISDAFDERHSELIEEETSGKGFRGIAEVQDEYSALGYFWVPKEARWPVLRDNAKLPEIGSIVDKAMESIEEANPRLKDVLAKNYSRPTLDKQRLGELIDLFSNLDVGTKANRSRDMLGQVYEYFLAEFASKEGKQGGEFYTPAPVVRVLVEMLAPYKGRVYDPCCGSGGMFVQSEKFVEEHQGRIGDISIFGQESNPTTWKLAKMNLAIRQIEANLGPQAADTFHNDLHSGLKFDYILANPPFNISDWGGERLRSDVRWQYGTPPTGNANYAWVQHIVHHLAPNGVAGFILANGSLSTNTSGEGEIRKNLVEADLVDCVVSLPGQLFLSTQIPVSLWFLARNKRNGRGLEGRPLRDRSGEILFIDARKLGRMEDRVHRTLDSADISSVSQTYHAWRGDGGPYEDVAGFCKVVGLEMILSGGGALTPGRYVGAEVQEGNDEDFTETIERLTDVFWNQSRKARELDDVIATSLRRFSGDA